MGWVQISGYNVSRGVWGLETLDTVVSIDLHLLLHTCPVAFCFFVRMVVTIENERER